MSQRPTADDRLLDAALDCVMTFGVRRTTFSDVARRAGVSRMTLYRRHPDVAALLAALMTREFGGLIALCEAAAQSLPTARERLVDAMVGGAEALAAHPLFQRVLDVDPELLLPYLTVRLGETQELVLSALGRQLQEGRRDGSIRDADHELLAACVELAARGFVLAARSGHPAFAGGAAFAELRRMLDRYLAPEAT